MSLESLCIYESIKGKVDTQVKIIKTKDYPILWENKYHEYKTFKLQIDELLEV